MMVINLSLMQTFTSCIYENLARISILNFTIVIKYSAIHFPSRFKETWHSTTPCTYFLDEHKF